MDYIAIMKAVVLSANQYSNNNNESDLVNLQTQLDALINLTNGGCSYKFFSPEQILPTECLSCLVNILKEASAVELLIKTITVLQNLAIDNEVKEVLHNNYELTPIVASTILKHSKTPTDRIVLQCVQLLQRITYNCRILYPNSMIDDLLTFLMTHIQGTENQLTLPCLGLMANLCKNNVSIQAHIKSMDSIKSVYKALIQYLSHRNLTMIVFALSVITSLCLNEDLGNKLFQAKNVNQTFQLLFNILIQGEDLTTIQYVADLFVFLLKSPKIQQSMLVFEDLSGGIQEVLKLLTRNSEPESICKTFELLLAFCKSSGIRCTVCHTLMSSPLVQNCESVPQHPMQLPGITQPFYAVLHWTRQTHATHDKAPLLALDFLKEIYEEMLDSGLTSQLSPRIDLVLPTLSEKLHPPTESDDKTIKHQCVKSVKIIDIIQVLAGEDSLKSTVCQYIDIRMVSEILEHQLNRNIGVSRSKSNSVTIWSDAGVDVVLHMLELMYKIQDNVHGLDTHLLETLQDPRLISLLSYALTSDDRDKVQIALHLVSIAAKLPDFSIIMLGDSMAANNSCKAVDITSLPLKSATSPCVSPSRACHAAVSKPSVMDMDLLGLTDKMHNVQTRENQLKDLLEAKAMALSQADRLISQYRFRKTQSEAQIRKLRSLLQDVEKRNEEYIEKVNGMRLENEKTNKEMELLTEHNQQLQVIAKEHEDLSSKYQDQTQRLNTTNHNLKSKENDYVKLHELYDMLQKHNEKLTCQHEVATERLTKLEEEWRKVCKVLKEREMKFSDQKIRLEKLEKEGNKIKRELENAVTTIEKLQEDLSKSDREKKKFRQQATALEKENREKDNQLHKMKGELEKQTQISKMIHSLTSGNLPHE